MIGAAAGGAVAFLILNATPSQPAAGGALDAALGKALFERRWVAAPASTDAADGLGPLFNAKSCAACHAGGGGAQLVDDSSGVALRGIVVRLTDGDGHPHPRLGRQLQDQAIPGLAAEGKLRWSNGAAPFSLNENAGRFGWEARIAPSLRAMSAIDGVSADAIRASADPDDVNGDGISGRFRLVDGGKTLGRFGLKAGHATLESQIAEAFSFDLGLSSSYYPLAAGDCTPAQVSCRNAPDGESAAMGGHELSDEMIRLVAEYLRALGTGQRVSDPAGETVFEASGCAACHTPALPAAEGTNQHVYSDLLLHDMGAARAGVVAEDDASVAEWRTAPLIDLFARAGRRRYMHDGQASSIDEAILLHGGEALKARKAYIALPKDRKNVLLRFLETL